MNFYIALLPLLLIVYQIDATKQTPNLHDFMKLMKNYQMEHLSTYQRMRLFIQELLKNKVLLKYSLEESERLGFSRPPANHEEFPCKPYIMPRHGNNVNELVPGDIKVIAAMGDSLTAGLGINAKNVLGLLTENKGYSFSIGGREDAVTMTNFLRVYNPNITGYSLRDTRIHKETDGLNMAKSGGTAKDMLGQAELLISKMKADPKIDMKKDWKLINILIGNNDVCRSAEFWNKKDFTIPKFKSRMIQALDKLKKEVPRAFVNIITMLDVYEVKRLNIGFTCTALHAYACPGVAFSFNINKVKQYTTELQKSMFEIVANSRYETSDFTVVVQPFFTNTNIPEDNGEVDLSYFAPDCFHLSRKGHGQVALSLWNSLFDKVGRKRRAWHAGENFDCPSPTKNPYLQTKTNAALYA